MTDSLPEMPQGPPRTLDPVRLPVRIRRHSHGEDHFVSVDIDSGTRLDRITVALMLLPPTARFSHVSNVGLIFRVDDPDYVETRGSFAGFVSGGMSNIRGDRHAL